MDMPLVKPIPDTEYLDETRDRASDRTKQGHRVFSERNVRLRLQIRLWIFNPYRLVQSRKMKL
jgi:hypothetical protein